ncbi:MAG: hypothetical protein KME03_08870 [Aphanocapsa lilacina HA4352-LM1]|jgi:NTP pyrophosphatase (non-canonical NTP hydrolase)|nr:hypothetical protein [Aphanocapsa lilacina HA4352-LM1]
MHFDEYQRQAKQTDQFEEPDASIENSLVHLSEKVNALAKAYRDNGLSAKTDSYPAAVYRRNLGDILWHVSNVAERLGLDFDSVAQANLQRIKERWNKKSSRDALFDDGFPQNEQLPRKLRLKFTELSNGGRSEVILSTQLATGMDFQLGSRITDNSRTDDGYRYHDVFHLAHAAVLGWSPVLRALMKVKRKSDPRIDETEDGARAISCEEGLTAFVFQHAKERNYFEGADRLEFELLRTLERMAMGLEAGSCHYSDWTKAVLEGYRVFRLLMTNRGGYVDIDLTARRIEYVPLDGNVPAEAKGASGG